MERTIYPTETVTQRSSLKSESTQSLPVGLSWRPSSRQFILRLKKPPGLEKFKYRKSFPAKERAKACEEAQRVYNAFKLFRQKHGLRNIKQQRPGKKRDFRESSLKRRLAKKRKQIKRLKRKLKAKEKTLMLLTHEKEAQGPSTQINATADDETKQLKEAEHDTAKQEPCVPRDEEAKAEGIWDFATQEGDIKTSSNYIEDFFNDWLPQEPASPFVDRMLRWDGDHLDNPTNSRDNFNSRGEY